MKKVLQSVLPVTALLTLLIACKKEGMEPVQNETSDITATAGGLIPAPKTYTLTKHGADTILFKNGKIDKIQRDAANHTDYSYGQWATSFYTVAYVDNKIEEEIQYLLDSTLKIERTWHKTYPLVNGVPTLKEKHYYHEFFPNGKLKKRYNGINVGERSEYIYDANGNLKEVQYFYTSNGQPYRKVLLSYTSAAHPKPLNDKLKLNFKYSGFNPHAKVFGSFSKYLPVGIIIQEAGAVIVNEEHTYTLNADGFPVKCEMFNKLANRSLGAMEFKYAQTRSIN
jgi:hypothetical protein